MSPDLLPLGSGDHKVRPRLKAIGIGGAGCNTVSSCTFEAVGLCTSRDSQSSLPAHRRLLLSEEHVRLIRSTPPRLLGTMDHECVRRLRREIGESDLTFIFTGLGGETGSYLTPGVAHLCRRQSGLVIASATLPFSVEGAGRREVASMALPEVVGAAHATITYPNDGLLRMAPNLPLHRAFRVMDNIMMIPAMELGQVLTQDDLPTLRSDLARCRCMRMGMGMGQGMRREELAVNDALSSPWLDFPLERASMAVVVVCGESVDDHCMSMVLRDISSRTTAARIRYAARSEPSLGDRLKVMVLLGT